MLPLNYITTNSIILVIICTQRSEACEDGQGEDQHLRTTMKNKACQPLQWLFGSGTKGKVCKDVQRVKMCI